MTNLTQEKILEFENYLKNWNKLIYSNHGIFQQTQTQGCIGPRMDQNGHITGHAMVMESTQFGLNANPNQQEFENYLEKNEPTRHKQYILTIIGVINLWKNDIQNLIQIHQILTNEIKEINVEIKTIQNLKNKLQKDTTILQTIEKIQLKNIQQLLENQNQEEQILNQHTKKIQQELQEIERFLKEMQDEMPFLFI